MATALTMSLAACTNEDDLIWQEGQNGVFPVMFSLDANDVILRNFGLVLMESLCK